MKKIKPKYTIIIVLGALFIITALSLYIWGNNSNPFKKSFSEADYVTVEIVNVDGENEQLALRDSKDVERLNHLFEQYEYKKLLTTREQYSYVIQDYDIVNITFWRAGNLLTDCVVFDDKIVVNGTVYIVNSEKAEPKLLVGLLDIVSTL